MQCNAKKNSSKMPIRNVPLQYSAVSMPVTLKSLLPFPSELNFHRTSTFLRKKQYCVYSCNLDVHALCKTLLHPSVFILKGIVHLEINFWYILAHLKGIQDVVVFVSTVFSILIFLGQTVLVCQSYNAGLWAPPQTACAEKSKLNMI